MRQPISTLTNIGYFVSAYFWFAFGWWLVGIFLCLLAVSSGLFHGTENTRETRKYQSADIISIFGTFNSLIGYFLMIYGIPETIVVIGVLAVTAIMAIYERIIDSFKVVGVQFLIMFMLSYALGHDQWYIAFFVVAMLFNIPHLLEDKMDAPYWFHDLSHGFWHVITQIAFVFLLANQIPWFNS